MPPTPGKPFELLVIEDEDLSFRFLSAMLKASGLEANVVRCGRLDVGLKKLAERKFDCVILDLNLPNGEGVATAEMFLTRRPETVAVVVVTADESRETELKALRLGIQEFLPKFHVRPQTIRRAIENATARHEALGALIVAQGRVIADNLVSHGKRGPGE